MGLGATLVGAIVGAAVGVGLHQFLEVGMQMEASWFFIVIGLLTGLGVRQANKAHMGVSYLRGAISGLVALGAIVLSIYLVSILMAKRDTAKATRPAAAAPAEETTDEEETDGEAADAATEPAAEPDRTAVAGGGPGKMGARADEFNTLQFVFMAVGAFLAYEFGRGSAPRAAHGAPEAAGEPVVYTDPSN
jgi:hypothetical protein